MLSRFLSSRVFGFLLLIILPNSSAAQNLAANDSRFIIVDVTVKTRSGNYATGLSRDVFQIMDEKQVRAVEIFEGVDAPASVGILIDTSSSMQFFEVKDIARPRPIGEAVVEFLRLSNDKNVYFVAAFDTTTRMLTDWKSGQSLIQDGVNILVNGKNTAFYDACFTAIEKLGTGHHNRKILIVFSDGLDNLSRHTFKELRELLKKSDVTLYALGIYSGPDMGSALGNEGRGILEELAEVTGGEVVVPENKKQLSLALNVLATKLRAQYRIGFRSGNDRPNKWHKLKVVVNVPSNAPPEFGRLSVRTRQGYYVQ